jgi:hypothetical protein
MLLIQSRVTDTTAVKSEHPKSIGLTATIYRSIV